MKFNEKLQALRKSSGMSQENLAEHLGVTRQAVSKWEIGGAYPETEKLITMSEMFGVTIDSLVKDSEVQPSRSHTAPEVVYVSPKTSYEYKSARTLFGLPLVHINIGYGFKKAKGIIAIGNIATGVFSIGLVSMGLLSIGMLSLGIISLAALSAGVLAVGSVAVGGLAIGSLAIGVFAVGSCSVGMFAVGAYAVAQYVAIGNHASGYVAIGETVKGFSTIQVEESNRIFADVSAYEVRRLIETALPNMWGWVVTLIARLF